MSGRRDNKGKPRHSLRSPYADEGLAMVFTRGAVKYTVFGKCDCAIPADHTPSCASFKVVESGDWNWAKGLSWSETLDSLERHLVEFKKGKLLDDGPGGTGLPHIDQIAWNAHVLSHFQKTGTGTDDRHKFEFGGTTGQK